MAVYLVFGGDARAQVFLGLQLIEHLSKISEILQVYLQRGKWSDEYGRFYD